MGKLNFLVEGVSGSGKTTVADELQRRGYQAIHGDRELAYQGDPVTGEPTTGGGHHHHIWDVAAVRALVADQSEELTFLCGGSRNFASFIDLVDAVFVLDVDLDALRQRLDARPHDEWGSGPVERELILRLHRTREDLPLGGIPIDSSAPVEQVVDEIVRHAQGIAES